MLAVAVAAIGIIAILALFPDALQSSRDAADRTLAATIAQDAISQLRAGTFTNNLVCTNANCSSTTTIRLQNTGNRRWGYTQAGALPTSTDPIYYCFYVYYTNLATGLSIVDTTVVWPTRTAAPTISPPPPNTNRFITYIAQYQ